MADKAPAMTKPKGRVLTPQGIKNKMPESKLVPTQILNRISKINSVMAAIIKGFAPSFSFF